MIAIFSGISFVKAENGVGLNAQVMPRKITDTINDFDFSKINPLSSSPAPKLVKGAATSRDSSSNIFTRFLNKVIIFVTNIF